MRLYQTCIPNALLKKDSGTDHLALICSRAWEVLNDEGNKQVLIFRANGDLFISTNGVVFNGSWTRISDNTVILSSPDGSRLYHAIYRDNIVFALQQDGKDDILFLINTEQQFADFPKSEKGLQDYFASVEENLVLEEERKRLEEERKNATYEAARLKEREELAQKAAELKKQTDLRNKAVQKTKWVKPFITTLIVLHILAIITIVILAINDVIDKEQVIKACTVLIASAASLGSSKASIVEYYIDRYIVLRLDYFSTITQKIKRKSFCIRLFGWLFAYFSVTLIAFNTSITWDEPWYIRWGFVYGLWLGFVFWVWIGRVLARQYELKTIGQKL